MGLSQYFAKIHAVDLLGWGLSSRPDFLQLTATTHQNDDATTNINTLTIQSSEDFFVESLEAWRKAQNIDRMILAGHSMGGYISVAYCERYPERVQRLILISPAGVPEETPADLQRRERRYLHGSVRNRLLYAWYKHWVFTKSYTLGDLLRSLPESYGRNRFAEQYVTRRLPSITDPQEQQTLTDYLYHNNTLPGSGEYCLAKFLTPTICGRHPLVHRIPNLRIASCDFLYGETDWMDAAGGLAVEQACTERRQQQSMQPSTGANTASSITPHINVYQISRAGHLLMLENNVEFNHALVLAAGMESFLDANARRSLPQKLRPMTNHSLQSPPTNTPEHYPEAAAATTQVAA
jgi:cardiolipin-specific phospholipase